MVAQAVHGHVSKATMFPEKIYHPLVAGMFFGLSISAGCASWESMAREGDLGGACRAIDDIENPRRQADARAQVSRDYTQESDADARIRMLTSTALENPEVFDASRYQVVEVQSNVRIEPRALVRGDALWLVVDDAVHGQALIDSVGMRVSERSAPVSQSMSEADVKLEAVDEVEVGTRVLSEPWSRVDETLDDCTRQEFLPTRCRAGIQRQPE